ncbi:NAD(P)-dependent oxidoreductase [Hyphomicrobiales bacterium 4NK60-0047b]
MTKASWLGLGVMGHPMAGYLSKFPDIDLTVYNRTTSKAEGWQNEYGGNTALTPLDAGKDAQFVFSCVGNDDDLRQVTFGDQGAFHSMPKGAVFIDHSTTSATVAREISTKASEMGLHFLDAPVTGGQKGAENGQLSIMVGGEPGAYEQAEPLILTYSKAVRHMGPSGAGQQTKMVNQIAIAGVVQGLSEAINFAQANNLNIPDVLSVISKGAAQSWQMENSGQHMADRFFDFGFAVDWMRKDLNICIEEAKATKSPLPVATLVESYLGELHENGRGRNDITSLVTRLKG